MKEYPIKLSWSGAIRLGEEVVCDGFHFGAAARVQTHVHDDHMHGFEESKGYQQVLMTEETKRLLIAEFNADLIYRDNIVPLVPGIPATCGSSKVTLVRSGHMMGAAQVQVQLKDGLRLGYSSDFQWPLQEPIQVDVLVVDSTYGSPDSVRLYSQEDAESQLVDLVRRRLPWGPVHIKAHRGTIQRSLQILSTEINCPLVGSPRFCREADVYRHGGYTIGDLLNVRTPAGMSAMENERFVRFYGKGDGMPADFDGGTTITLSAFMSRPDTPLAEYSERSYRIAMSNHADFLGTLEYIRATGASTVIVDNTRGGKAFELAREVRDRLGIEAVVPEVATLREWGA